MDGEIYSFDFHPTMDALFTGGNGKVLKWDYKYEKIIDKVPIEDLTGTVWLIWILYLENY